MTYRLVTNDDGDAAWACPEGCCLITFDNDLERPEPTVGEVDTDLAEGLVAGLSVGATRPMFELFAEHDNTWCPFCYDTPKEEMIVIE